MRTGQPSGATASSRRRRLGGRAWLITATAVVVLVGTAGGAVDAAPAQSTDEVEVSIEAGIDGVVGDASSVPVQVTLTSPRARTVDVRTGWELVDQNVSFGVQSRSFRMELPAETPVTVDVAVSAGSSTPVPVSVTVTSTDGRMLADVSEQVPPDPDVTLVGIGASLARGGAPESTPTVAGIQRAKLVPLDDRVWGRPGVLDAFSSVVLSADDVDALTPDHSAALRRWVWTGGTLVLDQAPTDTLPVVDRPSAEGRTAVGAGWVRFSDGGAAAGRWDQVVEPAVQRQRSVNNGGNVMFGDGNWEFLNLIEIRFLPVWVVLGAVFGTALVAGPLLWFLLRTRDRRRLMWIGAPALSMAVAGVMLVLGQGVFARSEARASGDVWATPWGTRGELVSGIKGTTRVELDSDTQVIGSSPNAVVQDTGDGSVAELSLARNSFGVLALGPVQLDDQELVRVTAVAGEGTTANVSVENRSDATLQSVTVGGAGRVRQFEDVPPGETRTLPFEMSEDVPPLGTAFPSFNELGGAPIGMDVGGGFGGGAALTSMNSSLPSTRGLVVVTGSLELDVDTDGVRSSGPFTIRAVAPVTAEQPAPAALRVEAIGAPPETVLVPGEFDGPVEEMPAAPPTTVVTGGSGGGGQEPSTSFVRLSSPAGRTASVCAVHTMAQGLDRWDGARWVPLERVGERRPNPRFQEPNEVQDWQLPALSPGDSLLLRVRTGLPVSPVLLFDCAGGGA